MQYFKTTISPTSTVYRPIEACAYSAIYVFTVLAEGTPEAQEGETPAPLTVKRIVFEYTVPRNVPKKQELRATKKKYILDSDLVFDSEGNQVFKKPKDLYLIESIEIVPEMMSVPVTDPEEVARIEAYLNSNSI